MRENEYTFEELSFNKFVFFKIQGVKKFFIKNRGGGKNVKEMVSGF